MGTPRQVTAIQCTPTLVTVPLPRSEPGSDAGPSNCAQARRSACFCAIRLSYRACFLFCSAAHVVACACADPVALGVIQFTDAKTSLACEVHLPGSFCARACI